MADPHNPFQSPPPGPPQSPGAPPNPYGAPPNPYGAPPSPYGAAPVPGAPNAGHLNPYAAPRADFGYGAAPMAGPGYDMLASRGNRFLGSLLDSLIYMLFIAPPAFGLAFAMDSEDAAMIGAIIGMAIIAGIQWYLISTTGQSIAKRVIGMKIVKMDGSDVNFVSGVIMRSWVIALLGAVPIAGNFVGLINALMIFGQEQRCLHDYIAGTKVIAV